MKTFFKNISLSFLMGFITFFGFAICGVIYASLNSVEKGDILTTQMWNDLMFRIETLENNIATKSSKPSDINENFVNITIANGIYDIPRGGPQENSFSYPIGTLDKGLYIGYIGTGGKNSISVSGSWLAYNVTPSISTATYIYSDNIQKTSPTIFFRVKNDNTSVNLNMWGISESATMTISGASFIFFKIGD